MTKLDRVTHKTCVTLNDRQNECFHSKSKYYILSQAKQNDFGYSGLLISHHFKSLYDNKFNHSKYFLSEFFK